MGTAQVTALADTRTPRVKGDVDGGAADKAAWWRSTFAVALSGQALLWAAFPPLDWSLLAWLAPVPWVVLVRQTTLTGRRPYAAFGNSTGDQEMLEYTGAGDGARLMMLVLHDDAKREYAYGPATGLPDSKVGTFTQALYDEAKKDGWVVISMKNDWKKIFAFEP